MRTGGKILADLAQNTNSDVTPRDIVSKRLSESTQNLIGKVLCGRRRKRKRNHSANQLKEEEEESPADK